MSTPLERYQQLGLKESLPKIHRYPFACKELSLILRGAYKNIPKNLQSLVFHDTLTAFRLLPQMQTRSAVLEAHGLFKSVEATLPKQKKNLAVTEYKNAIVAHKRRTKARREQNVSGSSYLPKDVLVHVFSFLDMQSLVSVGLVCWLWNMAASDNNLWQTQYATFFGNSDNDVMIKGQHASRPVEDEEGCTLFWREAFKREYLGSSSKNLKSNRGYCKDCRTIVWLDNMKCSNKHTELDSEHQQIKPMSPGQVVAYMLDEVSSSESDSDLDWETYASFCAY